MRKVLISAVLLMFLLSSTVIASAATNQKIAFSVSGWYYTYDPATNTYSSVPVSANVSGNLRNASSLYLTPLTGTINIGGTEKQVNIKLPKQSEQIYYDENSYTSPNYWYIDHYWYAPTLVNIGGDKLIGNVNWGNSQGCSYSYCWNYGWSSISFNGLSEGKQVSAYMNGLFPTIN